MDDHQLTGPQLIPVSRSETPKKSGKWIWIIILILIVVAVVVYFILFSGSSGILSNLGGNSVPSPPPLPG